MFHRPPDADTDALALQYRTHAGFKAALRDYCTGMVDAPADAWPFAKLFNQFARYMVCYLLIHNYFWWRLADGPLPTLTALQRFVPSSPRQTAGLVAALKAGKLVVSEDAPEDRRSKLLRPADMVIGAVAGSALGFLSAAGRLEGADLCGFIAGRPEAQGELVYRSAAFVLAHGTLIDPFPRVLGFARRDCGYLVLCAVMAAHYSAIEGGVPLPLTQKALADRFRISAAHVGNLFNEAQRERWFSVAPPGRLTRMDPSLVDEFELWASWQMAHYRGLAEAMANARAASDTA
ncbi:MAG: hypothetical protein AB1592_10305 [Pseudomonadota bacterium]